MKPHPNQKPLKGSKEGLAHECVLVLGELASLFEERRRQLAAGAGLTVQQWQMLEEVQHEHFMPSMFAQQRASTAAAVSKILRQLTDKGLITAHVSEKDARQRDYAVTEKGKAILSGVREERKEAIEDVWLKLTRDELSQFQSVGREITRRLESRAANARPDPNE